MNNKTGRKAYSKQQYEDWLHDMGPFLKLGVSLNYATIKAGLSKHKDTIYRKFKLDDWFCEKINIYQQYPAEMINSIFSRIIFTTHKKLEEGNTVTESEMRTVRFFAEKHRSTRKYFGNQVETAHNGPLLPTTIEELETDYSKLGKDLAKGLYETENETEQGLVEPSP